METEKLWQSVLAQIQFYISKANFETWFKNTKIISERNGKVIIAVPNSFSKEWLEVKYNSLILKILRNIDSSVREISYIVENSPKIKRIKKDLLKKENLSPQLKIPIFEIDLETNLNKKYNFDNFVVGSFNELAFASATAVTKNPGYAYNPLFIYGGVGLGKTHLIQACGNKIKDKFKTKKIKYLHSNQLISDIITSIKNRNIDDFRKKIQQLDILIVDDVQFLSGKEKTQEEFFHIFNSLYEKNKQIILSSDKPPKAIPLLEARLKSRFEGGMIADIGIPDFETRIAILKFKASEKQINIPNNILEYIAKNITNNIRELEGVINQIYIYQNISKKEISLDKVENIIKKINTQGPKITTQQKIIKEVCLFYDVKEKDLFSNVRKKEIVKPRQVAMYLLRKELNKSFPSIGRKFKNKDHTTVIYAFNKIVSEMAKNSKLREEINEIKNKIYNN